MMNRKWFLYGPAFERAQVDEKTISLSADCAALEGRALLFFSDIHLSRMFPEKSVERLIEQAAALRPDVIFLGGDYAESAEWQRMFFEKIGQLRPPLGIFGVYGNNDCECFHQGMYPLIETASKAGVVLLADRTVRIKAGAGTISVAGLDEFRRAKPLRKPLFTGRDASAFRILLAHYPQSLTRYMDAGYEIAPHLCMAGHTHGGQYSVMGLTPFSFGFEHKYRGVRTPTINGWKKEGETEFLVSPGIGTSRLPFRGGVQPQIHLIHLEK